MSAVGRQDLGGDGIEVVDGREHVLMLLIRRVEGREGQVSLRTVYDKKQTAAILRRLADDYERAE